MNIEMVTKLRKFITGKHIRYFTVSFEILPGGWQWKPNWYRFNHKRVESEYREGNFSWLFLKFDWYRQPVED